MAKKTSLLYNIKDLNDIKPMSKRELLESYLHSKMSHVMLNYWIYYQKLIDLLKKWLIKENNLYPFFKNGRFITENCQQIKICLKNLYKRMLEWLTIFK